MIMPPGQPLLLPARPAFIWSSLAIALLGNMLPTVTGLGQAAWLPDLLALTLVFWIIHQPKRVGVGAAFVLGLVMDVHQTALLGQHALAYTVLAFLAVSIHRRLLWFQVTTQMTHLLPLFFVAQFLVVIIRLVAGDQYPGWSVWLSPVLTSLLWPIASAILLAPQRRPPDPDKHRPL